MPLDELLMADTSPSLLESAAQKLELLWSELPDPIGTVQAPRGIVEAIVRSINTKTKTYRYVLPTQLLAKVTDASLDCRSAQMQSGLKKPFDARSLCHGVIVPFDQRNDCVLGGSTEPYINNPVRIRAIVAQEMSAQRDKAGFKDLVDVLDYAQQHPEHVLQMFRVALSAIRDRLSSVRVVYPAPKRLSAKQTSKLIEDFLKDRSGGSRMQCIALGLFQAIGQSFKLYQSVVSSKVNAADASTGKAADLTCLDGASSVVLAVEVKDRQLRLHDLQAKLPAIREGGIAEALFLVRGGVVQEDRAEISSAIDRQFPSGHNIYVAELGDLLEVCLILFGEGGRRDLARFIGLALDQQGAEITDRRRWAALLADI